jgi:cysteine desulfurase/selenocysteine lyase
MIPKTDFPFFQKRNIHYFDNAATTQKPQAVLDALAYFYTTLNANVHRGLYETGELATQQYEQMRAKVAHFIGAAYTDEIIFTSGTTDGINGVAICWALHQIKKGDVIVLSELEHHANLLPWQWIAQRTGATLRFIPVNSHGELDMSVLDDIITHGTKLVAVTHTSNALGTVVDLAPIIARCQVVGARVLIDAAQAVSHKKISVAHMGVDFLVFSAHKMLGPTGVGVLYINRKIHHELEPYRRGGGMVREVFYTHASWAPMPHMLEAGTPPIAQVMGLGAAIDYITENVDFTALQAHEASLVSCLIQGIEQFPQIKFLGPVQQLVKEGSMVSFVVSGMHAHDVATYLDTQGIAVRAGHHCAQPLARKMGYDASVRVSFYGYNDMNDVNALLAAFQRLFA